MQMTWILLVCDMCFECNVDRLTVALPGVAAGVTPIEMLHTHSIKQHSKDWFQQGVQYSGRPTNVHVPHLAVKPTLYVASRTLLAIHAACLQLQHLSPTRLRTDSVCSHTDCVTGQPQVLGRITRHSLAHYLEAESCTRPSTVYMTCLGALLHARFCSMIHRPDNT